MSDFDKGIEKLVTESKYLLQTDLKAVFLFGSGNTSDFHKELSDLDFIYILNHIDYATLGTISLLRKKGFESTNYKVDIKPFTLTEFKAGIAGKGTFEFFNGWGLEMIKQGHQKCLYKTNDISLDYKIDTYRLKLDSLERAHYYITKLRKILGSDDSTILRGEIKTLTTQDLLKISTSAIKNVLTFCLAHEGKLAYLTQDVINQSKTQFGNIDSITKLMNQKNNQDFQISTIISAYNRTEQIYKEVVNE